VTCEQFCDILARDRRWAMRARSAIRLVGLGVWLRRASCPWTLVVIRLHLGGEGE
jgi:hypothetical protein